MQVEQETQSWSVRTWHALAEAIHGSEQDFTKLPISQAVFLLSIPMVCRNDDGIVIRYRRHFLGHTSRL